MIGNSQRPNVSPGGLSAGWYKPLTDSGLNQIHQAALKVLEQTGIEVLDAECRERFSAAGARLDLSRNRVFLPSPLVEDSIACARHEVLLCGRDPRHNLLLAGQRVYMGTGGAALNIYDSASMVTRRATLLDIFQLARLVDALENIHFYLRPCVACDVDSSLLDSNTFYAALLGTSKHVTGNCFSVKSLHDILEMGAMLAGGAAALRERPLLSFVTSFMISPLKFATETVQVLTEIVRNDMPVFLSSAPQAGATSPASLAGTLVQITAEQLAGLTWCQLVKPSTPVVFGFVPSVCDLRLATFVGGASEFALMNAAAAQIGQFYQVPVYNSSGLTDSKLPDAQAGYEKGVTGMAAALAGSNFIHHSAGMLESMLTVAYEQFVIDDDINGAIMRAVRGIEIDETTLAMEEIETVVQGEGHFLASAATLDLMNSEYYYPHTADRHSRSDWLAQGGKDMASRARDRVQLILDKHRPLPIPRETREAIRQRFSIVLDPAIEA